jgi:hypothetical protein
VVIFVQTNYLTRTAVLLALTLSIQVLQLPPLITGPLVNLFLAFAAITVGTTAAVMIGSLTPWVALIFGILPAPLYPAVPFIMIGNALYGFLLGKFYRPVWGGVLTLGVASLVKFLIIGVGAKVLLALPAPLAAALLWPQLLNAFLGGLGAIFLSMHMERIKKALR